MVVFGRSLRQQRGNGLQVGKDSMIRGPQYVILFQHAEVYSRKCVSLYSLQQSTSYSNDTSEVPHYVLLERVADPFSGLHVDDLLALAINSRITPVVIRAFFFSSRLLLTSSRHHFRRAFTFSCHSTSQSRQHPPAQHPFSSIFISRYLTSSCCSSWQTMTMMRS